MPDLPDETTISLGALRRVIEGATPGPWAWEATELDGVPYQHILAVGGDNPKCGHGIADTYHSATVVSPFGVLPAKHGRRADADYLATFDPKTALALVEIVEKAMRIRGIEHAATCRYGQSFGCTCGVEALRSALARVRP